MNGEQKTTNILIIDDMPDNIRLAAGILSRQGYRIAFDESGESALRRVKVLNFDLILLDIMMPEMDGYEVCLRLKKDPETKNIPVIFLTAKADTESIVRGFEVGGADYVTKPFEEAELLARVNTHLELGRHREHLESLVRERTEAIRIIFEAREEISSEIEENITNNINVRILPLLETLRTTPLTSVQKGYLKQIRSGLSEILSGFMRKLSSPKFDLTQTEIRIANLIKEGKSSKEIAEFMNSSESAINFHRNNLRKKLGLIHEKSNLKSFLQSLS